MLARRLAANSAIGVHLDRRGAGSATGTSSPRPRAPGSRAASALAVVAAAWGAARAEPPPVGARGPSAKGAESASVDAAAHAPSGPGPARPGAPAEGAPGPADLAGGGAAGDPPLAAGEVIVVTGTRSQEPRAASPVTVEVVDRARLVESGARTVGEALALRPGLWLERGVGGDLGISVQGLRPQYTLILVDGVRQIGRTNGALDLDRFGVEDLEQIEIVRGPSSVLYGSDAIGGVVNLVTRRPRAGTRVDVDARVDGRRGYDARGRLAMGSGGLGGAVTLSHRAGPAIPGPGGADATAIDAYEHSSAEARVAHRRGGGWRTEGGADYARRDQRGRQTTATGAVLERRNLQETAGARAAAAWLGSRSTVSLDAGAGLFRDQYLVDQRMGTALDQYQVTREWSVEARAGLVRTWGAHRTTLGTEVLRERLRSDRLAMPGQRARGAAYAQDEWRLGDQGEVVLVPAVRLDLDSQFGAHATPRAAARWQVTERAVVRASTGMGYRAPSFKELLLRFANTGAGYVVEGNPELAPETSRSVQIGGEWRPAPWLWLAADGYANRLRGLIATIALPPEASGGLRFRYANVGRARTAGLELYAIATRGRAGLEVGAAATRARDLDAGRALEGIPAYRVTVTARWRDPRSGWAGFAAAVLTGHRPLYLSEEPRAATRVPRRAELRARVARQLGAGLGAYVGVDNLLGAGDPVFDPIAPRTLYAGLELRR
jgi:outer membrane receptor for ferrienterochelin and colicins